MTVFSVQSTIFSRASVALLSSNGFKRFSFVSSFSSSAAYSPPKMRKRRYPIVSAVDIGGVAIARNGSFLDSILKSEVHKTSHLLQKKLYLTFFSVHLLNFQMW